MTVNRYLISCKGTSIAKHSRGKPRVPGHSHGEPFLPELVHARAGRPYVGESRANKKVKQLLITGSQSIFCSPFEKYHEKVRIF
jgi:hypothetical protein